MKKLTFSLLLLCLCSVVAQAQKSGKPFPAMACETLEGAEKNIPKDLLKKKSFLCLAYSQKAQEKLQKWLEEAIPKFVLRSSENSLFALEPYDVNTYFIAMYIGANKTLANKATDQLKSALDKQLHPYVLTYTGSLEPYKTALKMVNKDDPYLFVLNEKGEIIYQTSGAYTEKAMNTIEDLVSEEDEY